MQKETAARQIDIAINLWKPEISELILTHVETCGDKEEVEKVRTWLKYPGVTPKTTFTTVVTLVDFIIDDNVANCKMLFGEFNSRIPFLPIIERYIIRQVDDNEKMRIAGRYLRELCNDAKYKDNLQEFYNKWKKAREDTIQRLRDIADEMNNYRKNTNIAKVVGSSVSIVATTIAAGAMIAMIVATAAVAAPAVAIAGTVIAVTGGTTNAGASLAAYTQARRAKEESGDILKNQAKTNDDLVKLLEEYKEETKLHLETAKKLDDITVRFKKINEDKVRVTIGIGDSVEEDLGYVKSFTTEPKLVKGELKTINTVVTSGGEVITQIIKGGVAATRAGITLADDVIVRALQTSARVVGVVASVAIIGIDIHSIVKTSIELSNGSRDEAAEKIREAANELEERALPELKGLIIRTQLEAAEEIGIPEVTA